MEGVDLAKAGLATGNSSINMIKGRQGGSSCCNHVPDSGLVKIEFVDVKHPCT